jgi:acyl-CoA thioester hydrolase
MTLTLREATRADFARFIDVPTRWLDNDIYGHVNNVNYYSFFDTAVNRFLIEEHVLDIHAGAIVGFVVDTGCSYFKPVAFPDALQVGLRVTKLGTSSVRYELALFRNGDEQPSAAGHFVHVYVDRGTGRAVPIPEAPRKLLASVSMHL